MRSQLTLAVIAVLAPALVAAGASPAEQKIVQARNTIERSPGRYQAYNDLALALARRARETSDVAYYRQASEALDKSLQLAPGNFEAERMRVWLLLGRHEFAAARQAARALNRRAPDDVLVYGFLTDANIELGDYKEAEEATQWMLDIRPGNVPGLTRGAYLRELFGDIDGAIEFMQSAYQRTAPAETEDRAWILTQIAHLELTRSNTPAAGQLLEAALTLFPGYHYALGQLAEVRTRERRYAEASALLQQRYDAAPHPENLYPLAEALERAGKQAEARAAFSDFERRARAEMDLADNANRELIFYYADHANRPEEALRLARREMETRQDVYTRDAYAWALYRNGRCDEAGREMKAALAVGVRAPAVLEHARAIESAFASHP